MELFIGNLPPNTSLAELLTFFKAFKGRARFHLEKSPPAEGEPTLYAVAEFESERYARKMMERYAQKSLRGCKLVIREYLHRSYANERRAVNWREKPWRAGERRRTERRHMERELGDAFEDILASSQREEAKQQAKRVAGLKVQAYRDLARKS